MKKTSLLLLSIIALQANAQITITNADMPVANDSVIRTNANITTSLNFTTAGANQTWDYSTLAGIDSMGHKYNSINSAPLFALATFGPLASAQHKAQLFQPSKFPFAIPSPFNLLVNIDSNSVKTYFQSNTTNFAQVGNSANINGIDVPIANDSNDIIYKFPMVYGNADSCTSIFKISNVPVVSFLYYNQTKKRVNHVEGWGTLKLPNTASFNTLKVRSDIYETDSLRIDSSATLPLNFGQNIVRPHSIEYKWLAAGYKEPILTVVAMVDSNNVETVQSIKYLQTGAIINAINSVNADNDIKIYPNPATSLTHIEIGNNNSIERVILIDITGKIIKNTVASNKLSSFDLQTNNFQNGIYQLKIITSNQQVLNAELNILN